VARGQRPRVDAWGDSRIHPTEVWASTGRSVQRGPSRMLMRPSEYARPENPASLGRMLTLTPLLLTPWVTL